VPVAADHDELTFRAYRGAEGLEALAPEWSALVAAMPGARFNHFPEWYRAYLSSLEPRPHNLLFIAARRGPTLTAVCPLHFQDFHFGAFRPRLLGSIEDDQMQLSDFVFAQSPENKGLLCSLTQWLRNQHDIRWDELRLRKVSAESSIAYAARAQLPSRTVALRYYASAYFRTDGTYEQATQAMTAKFRSNLRRRNRIARETAALRHQVYRRGDELDAGFRIFLDLEASGWKGEAGAASAIRCQPGMLAFYSALARDFGARDECVINVLRHGDQPVAAQFCLQIGKILSILKIGFSEPHAKFAPGLLMLERVIQQACDDPGIDVLHLVNEPSWATFFRPLLAGVWSYCAPNRGARGMIVHLALLAKRRREAGVNVSEYDDAAQSAERDTADTTA
jgi:CelD/BcsL family acetyltransferase involved in cellulose biosynthesis